MLKTNSCFKWRCNNCIFHPEFISLKSYTNHIRFCSSNANSNISNGNSNNIIPSHHLECNDIEEEVIDEDERINLLPNNSPIQDHDDNNFNPYDFDDIDYNSEQNSEHNSESKLDDDSSIIEENKYMKFQHKFLSLIEKSDNNHGHNEIEDSYSPNNIGLSTKLNLGHVSSISKKVTPGSPRIGEKSNKVETEFGIPDSRDVLDIFIYCKTHYLSDKSGNDLIILIIQLFRRHPTMKTLFLHRNMRSITRSVNRALDSLYFSHEIHATLPYKLRGSNAQQRALIERLLNKRDRNPELIIASGIALDPMELLAEFAVSHDYEEFDFDPVLEIVNGERCYSRFVTAKLFHKIHQETMELCGNEHIKPFCFQFAVDATPVASGGVGNSSVTPVNVRFVQVKTLSALQADSNSSLVGFTPSLTVSTATLQTAVEATIPIKQNQKSVLQYLKTNIKYKFLLSLTKSITDIQKEGKGIELFFGRGSNQRKVKIMPVIINLVMDNQECFDLQAMNSIYSSPHRCRFCWMRSVDFYKFGSCEKCLQHPMITRLTKNEVIDTVILTQQNTNLLRNGGEEEKLRIATEEIWWKEVTFDKSTMPRGAKKLHLSEEEKRLKQQAKDGNIKFVYNPLPSHMFGFFTRWNTKPFLFHKQCSNLQIFTLDKLHSFGKGNMELCFRFTSVIIYLFGKKDSTKYRNNLQIIDSRIADFDTKQPSGTNPWGKKIERRLPGLSSTFSSDVLGGKNIAKISSSMITGGMIEATRFVEYLYQLIHSIGRDGLIIPNNNVSFYFPDGSGRQININPTIVILDAGYVTLALNTLLNRSVLTESELSTLKRLIFLCELTVQRLFALKQLMLQINSSCYVTKSHMMHVMPLLIEWFGYTGLWDTDIFESLHKYVKKLWKDSSRKLMYFQGKEILSMNRVVRIASLNNDEFGKTQTNNSTIKDMYLPSIGYILMKSNNNQWNNNLLYDGFDILPKYTTDDSKLPIHPILTLRQLNTYINSTVKGDNSLSPNEINIIHQSMKPYYLQNIWRLQLLKGLRLFDEDRNKSYIVYSKRDQIINQAPGAQATTTYIDRFNTIEVRYNDGDNGICQYAPARIFSILRFANMEDDNQELILLVVCWLKKDNLSVNQKRLYLADNLYSYAYKTGNLWLEIITPSQVVGPYIAFEDIDHKVEELNITRRTLLKQKFILQRSFFEDSTKNISQRIVDECNRYFQNIIDTIPLPTPIEFELFKSFGIIDDTQENVLDEIDEDF